jgi:DNA-binding transcriptional regulator GbsR (MarR family)
MSGLRKLQEENGDVSIKIPTKTIDALRKEFGISEEDLSNFIISLIEKRILENIDETNSKVFSQSQTKEIEDDLKGLGYI